MPQIRDDLFETKPKAAPEVDDSLFDSLVGGVEGVGSAVSGLAATIPQGFRMGAELLGGASVPEAIDRSASTAEAATYEPRSKAGKKVKKAIDDTLFDYQEEVARKYAGNSEFMAQEAAKRGEFAGAEERAYNTERTMGEMLGSLYSPGIGPHMARPGPKVPAKVRPHETEAPIKPVRYTNQNELFSSTHETIPVDPELRQQGFRNPYLLPDEERARLEAELNPPTEQRVNGQGEIFTPERAYEQGELIQGNPVTTTQGGPGRFGTTPVESPLMQVLEAPTTKLAGATEQSGMPHGDFQRQSDMAVEGPNSTIPYKPESFANNLGETKPVEVATIPFESGITPDHIAPPKYGVDNVPRETEQINRTPRTPEPPVTKGPGWTTRAGRRQRGAVDPEVFLEGIGKLVGFVPRSLEAAKSVLERAIDLAKDRRDIAGRLVMQKRLDQLNEHLSSTREMPKKQLSLGFGESQRGGPKFKRELPEGEDPGRVLSREEIEKIYGHELADMERKAPKDPSAQQAAREADLKLVERFKSGDQKAFSELFGKYQSRIESMLTRMLGETRAEDAFQETMRKAFSHIDNFKGQSSFYTWLFQTARNTALDEIRRYARRNEQEYDPNVHEMYAQHGETPEAAALTKERGEQINAAIEKLPDDMKNAWKLREIEELPYDDIARLLNISLSTAKMRVARARDQLAATLKEDRSKLVSGQRAKPLGQTGPGKKQGGAIDPSTWLSDWWSRRQQGQGPQHMNRVVDAVKQFMMDKRATAQEVLQDMVPSVDLSNHKPQWRMVIDETGKKSAKEMPSNLSKEQLEEVSKLQDISETERIGYKVLTDRAISVIAEGKRGASELIKWVVDNHKMIDQIRDTAVKSALRGSQYVTGKIRGFEGHVWGVDGALTEFRKMARENLSEAVEFKDEWINSMLEDRSPNFTTDRQRRAYEAISKQFTTALESYNKARRLFGMDEINTISNYFPALWMGDWRYAVRNAEGKVVRYLAGDTRFGMEKEAKALQKQLGPDFTVSEVYHAEKSKWDADTTAMQEAIRLFGADDPASKALQEAVAIIKGKAGFGGKRALPKHDVTGFLGTAEGKQGVRDMGQAIETYLTRMYTAEANLKKAKISESLMRLPLEVREQLTNTMSLLDDFTTHSSGGHLENKLKLIDDFSDWTMRRTGLGESASRSALSTLTGVMVGYLLLSTKFIVAQAVQHTFAMAKLAEMQGLVGAGTSYATGIAKSLMPDQGAREAVNWARKNGYVDSVIADMFDYHMEAGASKITKGLKQGTAMSLGQLEAHFVRLPTFLMFEDALRSQIRDPRTRYETAANLMSHYMVDYRRASKPMMYNHFGDMVGGAMSPFKTFAHNYYGQMAEYIKKTHMNDPKSAIPLITFLGTQAVIGGLGSIAGTELWDDAVGMLNAAKKLFGDSNPPIPTVKEFMMTSGFSDAATFGLGSALLGQDYSSSVAAPTGMGMLSAPPIKFAGQRVADMGIYAIKKIGGTATSYDAEAAALAASPQVMEEGVRYAFHKASGNPNQPVLNPKTKSGNYRRSEGEYMKDMLLTGHSIAESRANAEATLLKRQLSYEHDARSTLLSKMANQMSQGEQINPRLFQEYLHSGGSASGFAAAIRAEIKRQNFTYMEQQRMGNPSPQQALKQQLMDRK